MIGMFAYNIPFISIFLMMIAAIVTPLLPKHGRIPEKLSCFMIGIVGVMSAYLLYVLTEGGQSLSFNFAMGHFPPLGGTSYAPGHWRPYCRSFSAWQCFYR